MKHKIIDIKELTDSRELLEKTPSKFILGFIYIVLALVTALLLWSYFAEKEVVVKAQGVIQSTDSNIVKSTVGGQAISITVEEGDYVKKGDELIVIESKNLKSEYESIKEKIDIINEDIKLLAKYENSINSNSNLFSKTKEKEYYYKYLSFKNKLNQTNNTSSQEKVRKNGLESDINEYESEIGSIQSEKSQYQNDIETLKNNNSKIKNKNKKLQNEIDNISKNEELSSEQKNMKINGLKAQISSNKQKIQQNDIQNSQIKASIKMLDDSIKNQKNNIRSAEDSIEISNKTLDNYNIDKDSYRNNEIIQTQTQIKELKEQVKDFNFQLENMNFQLEDYTIKAQKDGQIHFIMPINENDILRAGTDIMKISSTNDDSMLVQLYIPATDIANIREGQSIKLHSYSLPYREYGFIKSKINKLDIDAKVSQENGSSFYVAESIIDNKALENSDGEKSYLKMGMPMEGKIITDSRSYLQLFLEKLDLWISG
ncbi:HlyD family efflux transporter periplasmic adaptor subunit [Senegalia massiliensis]|uniref:HlyD family efflux transporter periplasmic adaptor subunit n=1 Tax=Senegalia massiliensis TaxID=1720316 RepID=A0A845QXP9_9CLOT|nr:HlyD family efflux transporter periplasmic adaptor subunit [Senegalia massiliensis]NBI06276.1 HlyD family efflux transporter periplasmic adaptor subunit [Senegalia massiliensis]